MSSQSAPFLLFWKVDQDEWMDADETAAYLKKTPTTVRNIVAADDVPRHCLTKRGVLFSRKEMKAL